MYRECIGGIGVGMLSVNEEGEGDGIQNIFIPSSYLQKITAE